MTTRAGGMWNWCRICLLDYGMNIQANMTTYLLKKGVKGDDATGDDDDFEW